MNRQQKKQRPIPLEDSAIRHPLANEDGSVIVLVIMVLAIMTVIGIVSSDTVVTENFIVRNVGINKQNKHLVESALMQGLQQFMQINTNNSANFAPAAGAWMNSNTFSAANPLTNNNLWYQTDFTQRCLDATNSNVALVDGGSLDLLDARGENNTNLRYAAIGFTLAPGASVQLGQPVWRQGRIVAEYVSADAGGDGNGFGIMRMEIGVRQKW